MSLAEETAEDMMFLWLSITPLLFPVVPEVKTMVAMSSGRGGSSR